MVTADDLPAMVVALVGMPWAEAVAHAGASGALIGAYPLG
jgi:hypothetical protein